MRYEEMNDCKRSTKKQKIIGVCGTGSRAVPRLPGTEHWCLMYKPEEPSSRPKNVTTRGNDPRTKLLP